MTSVCVQVEEHITSEVWSELPADCALGPAVSNAVENAARASLVDGLRPSVIRRSSDGAEVARWPFPSERSARPLGPDSIKVGTIPIKCRTGSSFTSMTESYNATVAMAAAAQIGRAHV